MLRPITCGLLMAGLLSACGAPVPAPADVAMAPSHALTVTVRHQGQRRVQAVAADVERLAVEVQAGVTIVQFIDKADFAAGQTTLSFSGLPLVNAQITVKALDAEGRVIGRAQTNAVTGQSVVIDMTLTLAPTYLAPAVPTGGLTTAVTFDPLPSVGTVATAFPALGEALVLDSAGHPWVMGHYTLTRFSPTGTALVTLNAAGRSAIAADGAGHVWAADATRVLKLDAAGQALVTKSFSAQALAVDGQDAVWAATGSTIRKLSPAGDVLWSLDLGGGVSRLAVDRQTGAGWALEASFTGSEYVHQLVRISPDGVRLSTTALNTLDQGANLFRLAVDPLGHAWVAVMSPFLAPGGRPVFQVDPQGAIVGQHAAGVMANAIAFDGAGRAWVSSSSENANNLSRLSPLGARESVATVEGSPKDLAVAPSGDVWVLTDSRLTRLVP